MPRADTTDRTRARRRVVALLVAVATALLAAEFGLRIALRDRAERGFRTVRPEETVGIADPQLGWRLRGGLDTEFVGRGFRYRLRTDADGWRDAPLDDAAPRAAPQPDGRQTVLLLGDSFLWGWGVERAQRAGDLLQDALGHGVRIVNRAVPGYSTDQELWVLELVGQRLAPDVVVLGVNAGDARQNARTRVPPFTKRCYRPDAVGGWTLSSDATAADAAEPPDAAHTAPSGPLLWRLATGTLPVGPPPRFRTAAGHEDAHAHPYAVGTTTHMLLGRIAGRCRRLGARLVLLAIAGPPRESWLSDPALDAAVAAPDRTAGEGAPLFSRTRRLAEIARELDCGFVVLDAAEVRAVRSGRDVRIPGDWHWNAAGNRVAAQALLPAVRAALAR